MGQRQHKPDTNNTFSTGVGHGGQSHPANALLIRFITVKAGGFISIGEVINKDRVR